MRGHGSPLLNLARAEEHVDGSTGKMSVFFNSPVFVS